MTAKTRANIGLRAAVDRAVRSLWRAAGFGTKRATRRHSRDGFAHVENLEARQVMSATPMQVGMNLDQVVDYLPNWMFTDVFQSSRPWISHSFNTVTQASDFNGGAFIPVQTDTNGWPTQLATWTNAHGHLMQQRLGTLMFRELNGQYPAGTYRVEWDGTGDVVFGFDARESSRGRTADGHNFALLNVTPGNGGIYLGINSMSAADPIRDIHVWMPDYNGQSFAGQRWTPGADFSPFHPLYKERIDDFGILRFMQTQETNTSDIRTWADRRDASDSRQNSGNGGGFTLANGISVEHMVQLANELDADPWFNMPHMADDTFVRNFATYVRDNLEPGLTAYVEWSNEIWNYAPGFEAYHWIADQIRLPENAGLTHWQFAGREAARDMNVWSDVFAGQTDRIVRVAGGMAVNPWITERVIENMGGSFDAITIAPYFGPSDSQRASYSASTSVDQVLNDMRNNIVFSAQMTVNHQRLADDYSTRLGRDIQVLAYEGGQHLDGRGASYQNVFHQAVRDPRMADITRDYLRMQNATGLDAYVHYKLTDRDLASQYGVFGVLFAQDQPTSEAHVYRALLDAANGSLFSSTPTFVTLNAADPQAHEAGLGTASFRVTRGGDLSQPLTVNYSVGGNAIPGVDYEALSGTVTFPANENTAFIIVTPRDDTFIEATETVSVTLQPGAGYSLISAATATDSVSLISDDVLSSWSIIDIVATDPNASEAGRDPGVFTITRSGNTAGSLTVYLTNGFQTAQAADYDAIPLSVTFASGQTSATITVRPVDDATVENTESLVLSINPTMIYRLGASTSAQINITDNDVAPPPVTPIVTVVATDATASEVGNDNGVYTLTRTGNLNGTLVVRYTASGTATAGQDFAPLSGFAYFPWGAATTTVTVYAYDDPFVEPVETVTLNLTDGDAYDLGTASAATVNILSDEVAPVLPTVTLTATDTNAAERNRDVATFQVTRTGATTAPLTINYAISGTATNGVDYDSLNGSVTIAAGQTSATITVRPIDDTLVEPNESVVLTLNTNAAYNLGTARTATATIVSDDVAPVLPTVTLTATDRNAAERNRDVATFRVTRTGAKTAPLTVNYAISGTATNGVDYDTLSGSIVIPASASFATITVRPIDDTLVEPNESVVLTLSANGAYNLGTARSATATIVSDDVAPVLPTVTLTATDANAAERNRDVATFRVTRAGATTAALIVNYAISGTATNGVDYDTLSGSVVIPAGASFATITARPIDDTLVEPNESVVLTLSANGAYNLGTARTATATIVSDDVAPVLPTVTLATTDATAAEANRETGTFTVTRTGATTNALVVNYAVSGSATNGSDYDALTGSVTIAAGQTSATITVRPIDDSLVEASETATVTLTANAAYTLGATTAGTVTIADNDVPAATPLPVLIVIANNDFYYTEYSAPRAALEAAGISVVVGAGRVALSVPHANTGYTSGNGSVMPDIALADARAEDYSAIVFVGGWGAAQYQYAFPGTYNNAAYNATPAIREAANRLINEFVAQDKIVTGVCYGVSVLAWARVDGQSPLQGRTATTAHFNSPTNNLPEANLYRWHLETNGATAFTGGMLGDQNSRFDDVIVDGRIITGENFDSAHLLGVTLADRLLNRNQPTTTLAATDATAVEANREIGMLTATRTGATAAALAVNYSVGGTATNGSDYDHLRGTVVIHPGQTTGAITVRPIDDSLVEPNETVSATLSANSAYALGAAISGTVTIADNDDVPTQAPLPVLMVIANNDFYYQEYADPRAQFESAGISVVVAAGRRELSTPHANSGQGSSSGTVMPDLALADVNAANYSAIVFVGGWGSSQYQYAFEGTYNNSAYNGTVAIRERVNQLINDFVAQEKLVTALCHGVSVLAWARVNGQSLLQGRTVSTYGGASPASNIAAAQLSRWHSDVNGATVFTNGAVGNTGTATDDVIVDGRIITGENYDSARQFGITLANRLLNP